MAKISTYGTDATVVGTDKVVGTDVADGSTKNYTIDGISDYTFTSLDIVDLNTAQALTNKSFDTTNSYAFNNAGTALSSTDVQDAIVELDSDVSTNATAITGKRNVVAAGTTISSSVNLSTLTADEYIMGGELTLTVDATANAETAIFQSRWLHVIVTGSGLTITSSGGQAVLGTLEFTTSGSVRLTKILDSTWMTS
tara:strand:- start:41493 stop:42083 length:591 start_codon:yes stop_codon:yes gene_type:complete